MPACSRKNKNLKSLHHCIYEIRSMSIDRVNCEAGVALSETGVEAGVEAGVEEANGGADDVLAKRAKRLAAKLADKEGLAAEMAKIEERKAKLKQYTKEYNDKKKLLLQELCAEADECAAKGLAMDSGRAAELAMMLEKKEKAKQATKAWKKENVQQEKVVQQLYYQIHKPEILESRKRQREDEKELCAAAGVAGGSLLKFGVAEGCRGSCSPAMCSACLAALRAERHPVRQRVNEAYEIAAVEEQPLPICAEEEAAFRAAVASSTCQDGCKVLETELRTPTCAFWGKCRRCHAVEHRRRDAIAAQRRFYESHTAEVKESQRVAHAHWVQWLDSWLREPVQAGVVWRAAFEQELAALIARRR